jgi:hypothetical protein
MGEPGALQDPRPGEGLGMCISKDRPVFFRIFTSTSGFLVVTQAPIYFSATSLAISHVKITSLSNT